MRTDRILQVQHVSVDLVAMFIGERCFGKVWLLLAQSSNLREAPVNLNIPISSFLWYPTTEYYSYSSMPPDQYL